MNGTERQRYSPVLYILVTESIGPTLAFWWETGTTGHTLGSLLMRDAAKKAGGDDGHSASSNNEKVEERPRKMRLKTSSSDEERDEQRLEIEVAAPVAFNVLARLASKETSPLKDRSRHATVGMWFGSKQRHLKTL
jgi:hypothetical protein